MTPFRFPGLRLPAPSLLAGMLACGMLSGCASAPGVVDESADFAPVDYRSVCLLENDAVEVPRLVDAIEAGLRAGGAGVRRLKAGTGPAACPFVLAYDVPSQDGSLRAIRFQSFEHGIPRADAVGRAPEGRNLTVGSVEAYAREFLGRLEAAPGQGN